MRVAIIGRGEAGQAIERAMTAQGISTQLLSRSSGFDLFDPTGYQALGPLDVVVEATGTLTIDSKTATDFFTRSTRAAAELARVSGATKHILLSIVNCEKPEVQGYGYYAGKTAQEKIARSENAIIVRSTQWFEFADQMLKRLRFGPVSLIPSMLIQPIAVDTVAQVITDCATGERSEQPINVAGREAMTLWDLVKRTRQHRFPIPVPIRMPGSAGKAFTAGALLPGPDVELLGPTLDEWLATRSQP